MTFNIKRFLAAAGVCAVIMIPTAALATSAGFDITIGVGTQPAEPPSESPEGDGQQTNQGGVFTHPGGFKADESVKIAEGVYAGSINLGGLTPSQAREAIEEFYANARNARFSFEVSAGTVYNTTLEALGFSYDTTGVVEEAAFLGQYGLLTQRYKDLMDLKYDKVTIPITYNLDEEKLTGYIRENIASHDVASQNATITRKNGEFIITPSVTGVATDISATAANVRAAVSEGVKIGMTVEVVSRIDEPSVTGEALQSIQTRLGGYTTNYSRSPDGRKNNIKVATGNIDGTVLMPGESFSTSETMKEREPENGYQMATEYLSGESVEAYGGGVCQVATTLYQAALRAELQIDKRYNHSMLVSYVEPSFDAAISWGYKDMVFTNNTGYPIYIAGSANGDELVFNIYGKETRPANRKITFESVIIERVTSESQTIEDPTQPVGFIEKKGNNHDACRSYLVKKVYIDGTLTDTIKFREDSYIASFETIRVGTMPVAPSEPAVEPDPGTSEPVDTPTSADEPGDTGDENTTP